VVLFEHDGRPTEMFLTTMADIFRKFDIIQNNELQF